MKIYAGNLSYKTTDQDLRETFERFGKVDSAEVVKDKIDGRSKGFGFIEMPLEEEAIVAVREMNGTELNGRALRVNESKPRPADRPGFRTGRGEFGGHGSGQSGNRGGYGGGNRGSRGGDR